MDATVGSSGIPIYWRLYQLSRREALSGDHDCRYRKTPRTGRGVWGCYLSQALLKPIVQQHAEEMNFLVRILQYPGAI